MDKQLIAAFMYEKFAYVLCTLVPNTTALKLTIQNKAMYIHLGAILEKCYTVLCQTCLKMS